MFFAYVKGTSNIHFARNGTMGWVNGRGRKDMKEERGYLGDGINDGRGAGISWTFTGREIHERA